ncbi:Fis family transcriptional regulator [Mycobacteroides abscessus]|uniref:Fis family transcriptional regulator n=1 Tax=Mycobacteroides abscessus TaxID=36809 RepID=UPI002104FDB6|nr:Fis family transcriptional regulator [Mycobacteroides abscessus]
MESGIRNIVLRVVHEVGSVIAVDEISTEAIRAAVTADSGAFGVALEAASLEAAIDVWITQLSNRSFSPAQRARLILTVQRGTSPFTQEIRLLHAALLRASGFDANDAAVAAHDSGASFTDIGAVLGISRQAAGFRINKLKARYG